MIKGIVQKIIDKEWGETKFYSFFLKGQDGLYSLGEHVPSFKEGDSIKFEVKQKGKYLYANDIVPWDGQGTQTAPQVQSVARSSGRSNFAGHSAGKSDQEKQYWANKDAIAEVTQRRIEVQAARNAAIEAARFLIEREFVKTPTKQSDKYDTYMALVNQLTDEFIKNTGTRLEEGIKKQPSVEEAVKTETASVDEKGWD